MLFSNKVTWPMQLLGRKDGENAIKQGGGVSFNKTRRNFLFACSQTKWLQTQGARPGLSNLLHAFFAQLKFLIYTHRVI